MKVTNEIRIYEVDGKEFPVSTENSITVTSHWNRSEMVVICIGDKSLTVSASQLEKAIKNATNWK